MNRQDFTHLLSQTQSMMAPSRIPAASSPTPLSPRQKFQAHIRTLSETSPHRHTTSLPKTPQLQHVSSLRVQRSESPSPTRSPRPSPAWTAIESASEAFSTAPQFITEEREVWSRCSPPSQRNDWHPFAPLLQRVDINDRPKTRHGHQEDNNILKPSKFAEGSMNNRSAGISSTWIGQGGLFEANSGGEDSDHDTTPRPSSPERSSIDMDEFNPQPVVPPSFAQRLFKFGTKSKKISKDELSKVEPEPQTARKKKGLRKSMSMWTLHGDKKKDASQVDLASSSPLKPQAPTRAIEVSNEVSIDILNDRKRRAEEAYAQQFKRRKSSIGVVGAEGAALANAGSGRRRISWSSSDTLTTDPAVYDAQSDTDLQKRPSRRELEKENQQLRALLRQKQYPARDSSLGRETSVAPPVPSPDHGILKPLGKNVTTRRPSREDLKPISEVDDFDRGRHSTQQSRKATAKHSRRASLVRGGGLPRPVSMIIEQDEGPDAAPANHSNVPAQVRHPLKDIPKLNPTPMGTLKKAAVYESGGKGEPGSPTAVQLRDVERENWEWPDDVF